MSTTNDVNTLPEGEITKAFLAASPKVQDAIRLVLLRDESKSNEKRVRIGTPEFEIRAIEHCVNNIMYSKDAISGLASTMLETDDNRLVDCHLYGVEQLCYRIGGEIDRVYDSIADLQKMIGDRS